WVTPLPSPPRRGEGADPRISIFWATFWLKPESPPKLPLLAGFIVCRFRWLCCVRFVHLCQLQQDLLQLFVVRIFFHHALLLAELRQLEFQLIASLPHFGRQLLFAIAGDEVKLMGPRAVE